MTENIDDLFPCAKAVVKDNFEQFFVTIFSSKFCLQKNWPSTPYFGLFANPHYKQEEEKKVRNRILLDRIFGASHPSSS